MRVAHLLRKYNPAEWGGTETAVQQLFEGLEPLGVTPVIYSPRVRGNGAYDPLGERYTLKRFHAFLPMLGVSAEQRQQMIAVGGNLMSFDLPYMLWGERRLDVIHSHALGRIGAIGGTIARMRRLPFVITIHGGVLDLPLALKDSFAKGPQVGLEWGKVFGALLRARTLLADADAILTCNTREAELLQRKYPRQRVQVQPHGVMTSKFEVDCRAEAERAWPAIRGKQVLLVVARLHPVKNQAWLLEQLPEILRRNPNAILALAGSCTDQPYGDALNRRIRELGLEQNVVLTGGLAPGEPKLLGLYQSAAAVLLSSLSETFGLVLLEAWAAGKPVLSSRTSGALSLLRHGENGWLFDLVDTAGFQDALQRTLQDRQLAKRLGHAGHALVVSSYDTRVLATRVRDLYQQLMEDKHALRRAA